MDRLLNRHEELRAKLQEIYQGQAQQSATTCWSLLYLPKGMCPEDLHRVTLRAYQQKMDEYTRFVEALEAQLARVPYAPFHPHPMLHMDNKAAEKRYEIMRRIGMAAAYLRSAQEHLTYWTEELVPVPPGYVNRLSMIFEEKRAVYVQLVHDYALSPHEVAEW